jgi:hypothetical protein
VLTTVLVIDLLPQAATAGEIEHEPPPRIFDRRPIGQIGGGLRAWAESAEIAPCGFGHYVKSVTVS